MSYGEKIKVYQVIECGSPTGSGRMVASICAGLDPGRFEISVVYGVRPGTTPDRFESLFPGYVKKIFVPGMVRPIRMRNDARAFWKLYRLFKEERPAVVHAHSSKAGVLARVAAWAVGVPLIFYSPHGYSFRMTDTPWIVRFVYFLIEFAVSHIGHIVVNGPSEVSWARVLAYPKQVLPYFNGINVDLLRPHYPDRARTSLTVAACGRITAAKNPGAFLRVSARLASEFPATSFVWIGGGNDAETHWFISQVKSLNLDGRIRLTGWLTPEKAYHELSQADVVIHYSNWDVLPTAVLEAMASGKPVVGSHAAEQILPGVTGYVAKSEEELLQHVRRLLTSPELRLTLGVQARKVVEESYSLRRLVAQLESSYVGPC
jgi:glycosyltransferase involved in cell wall biosynthesis